MSRVRTTSAHVPAQASAASTSRSWTRWWSGPGSGNEAVATGELAAVADVDGAIAQLARPLLFRRIVLDQPVGPADVARSVEAFLALP